MTLAERHTLADFAVRLAKELPNVDTAELVNAIDKLQKHATTIAQYNQDVCNRPLTVADNKRWQRALVQTHAIAAKLGIPAHIDSEPRGVPVRLILPSGYTNDWGRIGLIVPFRPAEPD